MDLQKIIWINYIYFKGYSICSMFHVLRTWHFNCWFVVLLDWNNRYYTHHHPYFSLLSTVDDSKSKVFHYLQARTAEWLVDVWTWHWKSECLYCTKLQFIFLWNHIRFCSCSYFIEIWIIPNQNVQNCSWIIILSWK